MSRKCPVCGQDRFGVLAPASLTELETRIREEFVFQRVRREPDPGELKDLTDFAHAPAAGILACEVCGLLWRDEQDADYAQDAYDRSAIERIYPRYLAAFRAKEQPYRKLLPPGSRVLEVGSHFGAFLEVAREWGWEASGVDIGKDTSQFAISLGLKVWPESLAGCGLKDESFDAIFVWNCFEQIPDEASLLREVSRILAPRGLLVLRTPNALFYRTQAQLLRNARDEAARNVALKAMGYNNLLGFPYLYGHSPVTLTQLTERFGFTRAGVVHSELLTFPLPDPPEWVEHEQRQVRAALEDLVAPWIELLFTRTPESRP